MPKSKNNKQKLDEHGPIHEQHLHSGIQFVVKYCGSQLIEDIKKGQLFSSTVVAAAIQSLMDFNRKVKRKSRVSVLTLSTSGIALRVRGGGDSDGESLLDSSIERIAYCTADKRNPRIFGFVARNRVNETVELHVCKCSDAKEPVQLAYTLNEAFRAAARRQQQQQQEQLDGEGIDHDQQQQQPSVWYECQALSLSQSGGGGTTPSVSTSEARSDSWVQFT